MIAWYIIEVIQAAFDRGSEMEDKYVWGKFKKNSGKFLFCGCDIIQSLLFKNDPVWVYGIAFPLQDVQCVRTCIYLYETVVHSSADIFACSAAFGGEIKKAEVYILCDRGYVPLGKHMDYLSTCRQSVIDTQ